MEHNGYAQQAGPGDAEPVLSLTDVFRFLFRRSLIILAGIILVTGLAFFLTWLEDPTYQATAEILLDPRRETVTNAEAVLSRLPVDSSVMDTEVEVLQSQQLLSRAVTSLNASDLREGPALSVSGLANGLDVRRKGLTYLIEITYRSTSASDAALVANTLAQLYLDQQRQARVEATLRANSWLRVQLAELQSRLTEAEERVAVYRAEANLLGTEGSTLTELEIAALSQQVSETRAEVAGEAAQLEIARQRLAAGLVGDDLGEALGSRVIEQLRAERARISARLADIRSRLLSQHPERIAAERELRDIDGQIAAELARIIKGLEANYQIAQQRLQAVTQDYERAVAALQTNNAAAVALQELERQAQSIRDVYESYQKRLQETEGQAQFAEADSRLMSRASIPVAPSSPKLAFNLLIGGLLGALLGAGVAVLMEAMDGKLTLRRDVEDKLGLRFLGALPQFGALRPRPRSPSPVHEVAYNPHSAYSECIRGLRLGLMGSQPLGGLKSFAFASALPNEAKSVTTACVALSAVQAGHRTLLIDCDYHKANLTKLIGLDPEITLADVMHRHVSGQEAIYALPKFGFDFVASDSHRLDGLQNIDQDTFEDFLAEVSDDYDLVLIDTAPVLAVASMRAVCSAADGAVLLTRWRTTPLEAARAARDQLMQAGATVVGGVLTRTDPSRLARLGFGDTTFYLSNYGQYGLEDMRPRGGVGFPILGEPGRPEKGLPAPFPKLVAQEEGRRPGGAGRHRSLGEPSLSRLKARRKMSGQA